MAARSPSATRSPAPELKRWRLLAWAAGLSLVFGGLMLGLPLENALRVSRNSLAPVPASGDIVLIAIDDQSLAEVGTWPWRRTVLAKMLDRAGDLKARSVHADIVMDAPTTSEDDLALSAAIKKFGLVVLPTRDRLGTDRQGNNEFYGEPLPILRAQADVASISVQYDYQHAVWKLAFGSINRNVWVPTFAASLAEMKDQRHSGSEEFRVRYAIDPLSVPTISAKDFLAGRVDPVSLRGKKLVFALTANQLKDQFWIPGHGRMAGAFVQILGAETLKRGPQVDLGWLALLGVSLMMIAAMLHPRYHSWRGLSMLAFAIILLSAPFALEQMEIFIDVVPAAFALLVVAVRLTWQRWRNRGLVDDISGVPNLAAFRSDKGDGKRPLIACRIKNYAAIASTIGPSEEKVLVQQIVDRLTLAEPDHRVFQGDEGIFAWFVEPGATVGNHLEALHSLFRLPVTVDQRAVDLAVSFGAELGSSRSLANRLSSALVAADEAWDEGLKWKYHDPARLEEVKWRLSLLGELDAAIDNGEVWLAYQPQLDLQNGVIIGAEALARWTHPIKGPIGPGEFIPAAEANGRIGKLTDFVLDRAIATAASMNRRGIPFTVAVNLSARLLSDPGWLNRVDALLRCHGLPPERLTLELTESAALDGDGGLTLLHDLRALGVRIALDDYGTGLSTLEYLKKIPAHEIKLDQSFIKAMRVNRGDLLMVKSTIALAHSLGRTVVAEGVEDQANLDDLRDMGCDVAQGYAIARPLGVRELVQRLDLQTRRKVA